MCRGGKAAHDAIWERIFLHSNLRFSLFYYFAEELKVVMEAEDGGNDKQILVNLIFYWSELCCEFCGEFFPFACIFLLFSDSLDDTQKFLVSNFLPSWGIFADIFAIAVSTLKTHIFAFLFTETDKNILFIQEQFLSHFMEFYTVEPGWMRKMKNGKKVAFSAFESKWIFYLKIFWNHLKSPLPLQYQLFEDSTFVLGSLKGVYIMRYGYNMFNNFFVFAKKSMHVADFGVATNFLFPWLICSD